MIIKAAVDLPVIGFIISLVFLTFGYCTNDNFAQTIIQEYNVNSLPIYIFFRKFSFFSSGIIFLTSVALILRLRNKKREFSAGNSTPLADLQELSWKDFKEYIASLFIKLGYSLVDKGLSEESADLKLKRDGRLSIVRCKKYYVRKVPLSMVLEFYEEMSSEPDFEKGYFITTGFFSRKAKKFASAKQLELIDGINFIDIVRIADSINVGEENSAIENCIKRAGYTCPLCGAQMILQTFDSRLHAVSHFWECSAYPACKGALMKEPGDMERLEY